MSDESKVMSENSAESKQLPERKYYSARELMKMPLEERNRLVAEALVRSQDQDAEILDAFDDADFDDESA